MKCTKRNLIRLLEARASNKYALYQYAKEEGKERDPLNQSLLIEIATLYDVINLLTDKEHFDKVCAINCLEEEK